MLYNLIALTHFQYQGQCHSNIDCIAHCYSVHREKSRIWYLKLDINPGSDKGNEDGQNTNRSITLIASGHI